MSNDDRSVTLHCWCGGLVGPRVPSDQSGMGCLENINHDWASPAGWATSENRTIAEISTYRRADEDG